MLNIIQLRECSCDELCGIFPPIFLVALGGVWDLLLDGQGYSGWSGGFVVALSLGLSCLSVLPSRAVSKHLHQL